MNFFSLSCTIQGIPFEEAYDCQKKNESISIEEFLKIQEEKKWAIFRYHRENNRLYTQFTGGTSICDNWEDIPILEKSDIQRPLTEILTTGYTVKNIYKNNTSGSTGKPFHF